jgi:hypothetical protein
MTHRQISCPTCGVELNVPDDAAGRFARCGSCQHRFQVPTKPTLDDEDILSLITGDDDSDLVDSSEFDDLHGDPSQRSTIMAAQVPSIGESDIRITRLDQEGVLFEFPAGRLRDISFRCSMPRICMRCSAKSNLRAQVIVFASPVVDEATIHSLLNSGRLTFTAPFAERMSAKDLLDKLPSLPDAPPPTDMPMPYWLCEGCDYEDMVTGHLFENAKTGDQTCQMHLTNLHRAKDFLQAADGNDGDIERLNEWCVTEDDKPWDLVPESVRQRLNQWFKPDASETFLVYIPDRALSRREEGMAGVVVSDKRLVYQSNLRHKECEQSLPITLQLAMTRELGQINIETPQWKVLRMTIDREGVRRLRRALTVGRFSTTWD